MTVSFLKYVFVAALAAMSICVAAQNVDSLIVAGDSLRGIYRFEESLSAYDLALEKAVADSLDSVTEIQDRINCSENGRNMASFTDTPVVEARHKFSKEDFFLYYPLPDRSWRCTPNQLDTLGGGLSRALYFPEGAVSLCYSAKDTTGVRDIHFTQLMDSLWTEPKTFEGFSFALSDEIYPMLSADGKTMYFASNGLYGVGGYDIYVSRWDDARGVWGVPMNMGFPYSSPADDFLYMNTEDGNYSIFASNRDCQSDSVWVYVLEFDNMPVRKAVDDPETLKSLAALTPQAEEDRINAKTGVEADIPENPETERYMNKMSEVRALRDTLSKYTGLLESKRSMYALSTDEDERLVLTNEILANEAKLPHFQDSLDRAVAQLQKIEMEFLFKGVVIDPDKLLARADQEVVGEATSYTFSKCSPGAPLKMEFMKPEVKFDYSFKILPEGCFAEDNTIPQGIVYQIQMFGASNKAVVKNLRGLSPVFESRTASGKYVYRVGLFSTYNDVLSKLNAVKKVGFRTAFIVAYIDGKEVSVSKARTAEADVNNNPTFYEVRITFAQGEMDASTAEEVRLYADGKDIAKMTLPDGGTIYKVGPYSDKGKADQLVNFIREMGVAEVACKVLGE